MTLSLSEKEKKIFDILNDPADVKTCAEDYGVSEVTVRNIKMLKTKIALRVCRWMADNGFVTYLLEPQKRFNKRQVAAIRLSTETSVKLAKRYNVAESTIRMIRTGKTYA